MSDVHLVLAGLALLSKKLTKQINITKFESKSKQIIDENEIYLTNNDNYTIHENPKQRCGWTSTSDSGGSGLIKIYFILYHNIFPHKMAGDESFVDVALFTFHSY